MAPRQILKAKELVVIVPDKRKAHAVKASLEGEITPMVPASILRRHSKATLYLDTDSASLLSTNLKRALTEESNAVSS
jgi:glucosamine-6-phosphate deaminase